MDTPATAVINLTPLVQYGFAGYAFAQLVIGCWIALKLVEVLGAVRDAVCAANGSTTANTAAVEDLRADLRNNPCRMTVDQLRDLVRRLAPAERGG